VVVGANGIMNGFSPDEQTPFVFLGDLCNEPHSSIHVGLGAVKCDVAGTVQACAEICRGTDNCTGFGFNEWYLEQIQHHNAATTNCCNLQKCAYCDHNNDWDWYGLAQAPTTECPTPGWVTPAPTNAPAPLPPAPLPPPVTPAPTNAPAPLPDDPTAIGDPHLTNTRGDKFNIMKSGLMEFLRVPYESASEEANLTVSATVEDMKDDKCSFDKRIASFNFGGTWLGGRVLDVTMHKPETHVISVLLDGNRVTPSSQPLNIGSVLQLHISREHLSIGFTHLGVDSARLDVSHDGPYLNMRATSLSSLYSRIGGLLGEDDHADASGPVAGCAPPSASSLVQVPRRKEHSFAFANI